jgi:isoamylase
MNDDAWNANFVRCLGVLWSGDVIDEVDEKGEKIVGDTLLILLNAHHEPIPFQLPAAGPQPQWELLLDTAEVAAEDKFLPGGKKYNLRERSLAVLRLFHPEEQASPQAAQTREN